MNLVRRQGFGWLYALLLRWRLTSVGRKLFERAAQFGCDLRCGVRGLRVRRGRRELWFDAGDAAYLWTIFPDLASLEQRLIFEEKSGLQVADCRGRELRRYRIPETQDFVWLPELPESADVLAGYFLHGRPAEGALVFDAGAFCGMTTIVLARIVGPCGRVFAFEPDAKNRALLERNIAEAGLGNVTVVPRGLWKSTTELSFVADQGLSSHVLEGTVASAARVSVMSFADACQLAGAVPSFVKMDIEGAEVETIEGALEFIGRQRIHFSIASYHDREGRPTSAVLEPLFTRIGYRVETGYPAHQTTWARWA
jgi:FkbM family methyltransferase